MTAAFDALIAANSGVVEYRFVIEGIDVVFVTSELMAGTQSDGRVRVPGLRREGLGFSERVYLAGAEHDAQIDSVVIEETGGEWKGVATRVFSTIARRICELDSTLGTSGTGFVPNGTGPLFTVGQHYYIGTETVKVTAVDDTVDPDELTLDRAEWDTAAQEHPVVTGEAAQVSSIYDAPTGFARRRCWLYAHTSSELGVASAGTVVWRGILTREPVLDEQSSLSWDFSIEPRTAALDASMAGGFDQPFKLRGIYYPGLSPLVVSVLRGSTAAYGSGTGTAAQVILSGFWEDQTSFCIALEQALNANATIAGWGITFSARAFDQSWDLVVTMDVTPKYISVTGGSYIDGFFDGYLQNDIVLVAPFTLRPGDDEDLAGNAVFNVSASTTYRVKRDPARAPLIPFEEQRRLPRHQSGLPGSIRDTDSQCAINPATFLHLARLGALTTGDDLVLAPTIDASGTAATEDTPTQVLRIATVSSAAGIVVASEGNVASLPPRLIASGPNGPSLTGAARYASGDGDLSDLRDDIIARAPTVANRGQGPWVTADDLASWTAAVEETANGRAWLLHRIYSFAKPVKAADVLREECKLAGLIPYLDADAKLALRPFTIGGVDVVSTIEASNTLVDETLGKVTGEADGLVTVVHYLTGYDPAEDKHTGGDVFFRGLGAIARVHAERVLEVAPMSRAVGAEPAWADLSETAKSIIALFGDRRTQVVTLDVDFECFGLLIGDDVAVTNVSLPSDGARTEWTPGSGMVERAGKIIGRTWDLADGAGTLEILLHELELAGYAPSAKVNSAAGATTSWTLTCTQSHYSRGDDLSYFAAGDAIKIVEWDAASPTVRTGVISGTPTATTAAVTLDSPWVGFGAATRYTLMLGRSDDADTAARQLTRSTFLAAASGRIPLVSGTRRGREYAP